MSHRTRERPAECLASLSHSTMIGYFYVLVGTPPFADCRLRFCSADIEEGGRHRGRGSGPGWATPGRGPSLLRSRPVVPPASAPACSVCRSPPPAAADSYAVYPRRVRLHRSIVPLAAVFSAPPMAQIYLYIDHGHYGITAINDKRQISVGVSGSTSDRAVSFINNLKFVLAMRDEIRMEFPLSLLLVLLEGKLSSEQMRRALAVQPRIDIGRLQAELYCPEAREVKSLTKNKRKQRKCRHVHSSPSSEMMWLCGEVIPQCKLRAEITRVLARSARAARAGAGAVVQTTTAYAPRRYSRHA
ncbi:hypothetical protein EVAR_21356_1 [Eumeta japonica]|uniref:Uncharacterized protein n=1 Tax=Eumeta variegata TaxID=151549 RepID=A0A4C1YED0_EUMVA|nr:hypothetical protein EVAR_21356_1 [Eumeta japonica]